MKTKKKIRFDELEYTSVEDALGIQENNKIVKIWCHIKELEKRRFKPKGHNYRLNSAVMLTETYNDVLCSKPISQARYNFLLNKNITGEPVEVIGKIVKELEPAKKGKEESYINRIMIMKTRSGDSPLRIFHASQKEIDLAISFLRTIKKKYLRNNKLNFLNVIKDTVAAKFKIKGLDKNARLSDSIETVIAQALSLDNEANYNGKIHICAIGPSASGKKLLMHSGHFLNYISEEAQPVSLSIPGITGDCYKTANGWQVNKGSIPLAHGGLFGIQDLDKSDIMPKVLEAFSPVMEDGICDIKKAGKRKYLAKTGIYIDVNRMSDKTGDSSTRENTNFDTHLPNHMISRFDYICELPKRAGLQFRIAKEVARTKSKDTVKDDLIHKYCRKNNIEVERFIKLIVAYICELYDQIDTSKVDLIITKKIDEIYKSNKAHLDQIDPQFILRFTNAIYKFVGALTRLQLRNQSNKISVEKTFQLLSRKLDFMKEISPELRIPKYRIGKTEKFLKWIVKKYGSDKFTIQEAFDKYCDAGYPAGRIKIDAFRTRVENIANSKEHGYWKIKTKFRKDYK